jgi:transcriptional regulator with XRE-family HTH domain
VITVGRLVKTAMERRGLNGRELAALIHRSPSYVSQLINDEKKDTPPPDVLASIEHHLGIAQEEMLRTVGYRIGEGRATYSADSERATLASLLPVLDESQARVLRITAQAMIQEQEAKRVAEFEALVVGIS